MKKNSNFTNYYMLLLVWICIFPVLAQEEAWEQMNGPYGGNITRMITGNNGCVCAATQFGGLYVSNDNGNHWTERISEMVTSLAVNMDGKLFAGGRFGDIYTSVDDGISWSYSQPPEFLGRDISAIAIDSSNRIYLGFPFGGLFRSDDNGLSWLPINSGLENLNYKQPNCLAVGTKGVIFAGFHEGIYRTTDYGANWSELDDGMPTHYMTSFVITNSGKIIGSSYLEGILLSENNGNSWEKVLDVFMPYSLTIDNDGNIFQGSLGSGIYKSKDEGLTWQPVNVGLENTEVSSLAINVQNTIFAGTYGFGVFRSSNSGLSWEESNEGLENATITCVNGNIKNDIFVCCERAGIRKSNNGGVTWTRPAKGIDYNAFRIDIDLFDNIYFDPGYAPVMSSDNGENWLKLPETNRGGYMFAFLNEGSILSAGSRGVEIIKNQGNEWEVILSTEDPEVVEDIAVNDSNYIFVTVWPTGLLRSKDMGSTWDTLKANNDSRFIADIMFINKNGNLFASIVDSMGSVKRIARSEDNGVSWTSSISGLPDNYIYSFAEDGNGCIYAATNGAGVYRSCDNGNSWTPFNSGLKHMYVISVYIDSEGYLYAGTMGGDNVKKSAADVSSNNTGINSNHFIKSTTSSVISGSYLFRIKTGGVSSVVIPKPGSQVFTLEQNFPNPFSTNSTIRFKLAQTENVSLKIYNSLGQIVLSPVNGRKEAGLHEVLINGTEMPAGVYFYRLQTQKGSMERKFIVFK